MTAGTLVRTTEDRTAEPAYPRFWRDPIWFVAVVAFLAQAFRFFNYCEDDVFIPMRYALNFWRGAGWVMNAGERVDGCTSPLHLWLDTILLKVVSPDTALFVLKTLGIVLGIAILAQTRELGRRLLPERPILWRILPLVVAGQPAFAVSMINGLETSIAAWLLISGLLQFTRETEIDSGSRIRSAAWFCAAALTRPELTLTWPIIVAIDGIRKRRVDGRSIAVYALPIAALCVFRIVYYGNVLPNTYYAKQISENLALRLGSKYILDFGFPGLPLLWIPMLVAGVARLTRDRVVLATPPAVVLGVHLLFLLRSGGDWMIDGRFCTLVEPLVAVFILGGIDGLWNSRARLAERYSPMLASGIAGLAIVLLAATAVDDIGRTVAALGRMRTLRALDFVLRPHAPYERWMGSSAEGRLTMARWVERHVHPGQTALVGEVGIVPIYNMDARFIDVCGLTDSRIAHMPGYPRGRGGFGGGKMWMHPAGALPAYIHERRPEWVALLWSVDPKHLEGSTDRDDLYVPYSVFPMELDGYVQYVATWRRRDVPDPDTK